MPAKKTESNEAASGQLEKNVRFYSKFMTTPKDAQKPFDNGRFKGTDINPMFRIKILTEVFGPAGFGWWTNNVRYQFEKSEETKEVHVFCELDLYVKDPETGEVSQPIYGIGGNTYIAQGKYGARASDEAKKMAYTDAMSIACKSLGIGHDIWYSNDRTKYTAMSDKEPAPKPAPQNNPEPEPEPKHNAASAEIIHSIEQRLAEVGENMTREEKLSYAKNKIVPIIGSMNYKACADVEKLNELLNSLNVA